MRYVKLGTTGLEVSPIAIGAMTYGTPGRGHPVWSLGEDDARPLIRHAVEAGINFLAPKQFALLTLLARHAGRVLTHRTILEDVWGADAVRETQHLRVCARMLRKKLGEDASRPRLITEPGIGYRLVDPDEARDSSRLD
jgi:DNA-binding response OmpR family regulator